MIAGSPSIQLHRDNVRRDDHKVTLINHGHTQYSATQVVKQLRSASGPAPQSRLSCQVIAAIHAPQHVILPDALAHAASATRITSRSVSVRTGLGTFYLQLQTNGVVEVHSFPILPPSTYSLLPAAARPFKARDLTVLFPVSRHRLFVTERPIHGVALALCVLCHVVPPPPSLLQSRPDRPSRCCFTASQPLLRSVSAWRISANRHPPRLPWWTSTCASSYVSVQPPLCLRPVQVRHSVRIKPRADA